MLNFSTWGEVVNAAVEFHDGATAGADDLISFVKQHLDSIKDPIMVHININMPKIAVGKILRRAAKDLFG
ncbi:MAG: hypothetical protein VX106_01335 [Pseudomonadota bacterium]|nr:hypothetical protein [Pseudomonadota bacterium]